MPVTYTNRKGVTYILCKRTTAAGKLRYVFARAPRAPHGSQEPLADRGDLRGTVYTIPDGFSVRESVNGVVSLVRDAAVAFSAAEVGVVEAAVRRHPKADFAILEWVLRHFCCGLTSGRLSFWGQCAPGEATHMRLTELLFPGVAGLRVEDAWHEEGDGGEKRTGDRRPVLHVQATTTRTRARCPCCGRHSRRVQSLYERTIAALPCGGAAVILHLRVRRFWCRVRWCRRRIFCERLADLAGVRARRTVRLADYFRREALRLGGEAGMRQAMTAGTPVSARTLLRLIRAMPLPPVGAVRVLGVDDWSRRKGHDFGTILVDLEAHKVLDLLPDRTAATQATWLPTHPELEIVSRDRASAYAEGVRQGAPHAIQVADRFHLLKNLVEVLERALTRHHAALRAAAEAASTQAAGAHPAGDARETPPSAGAPAPSDTRQLTKAQREQLTRRERRHTRYTDVIALHEHGHSQVQIAVLVGMGRKTIRRVLRADGLPERLPAPRRVSALDPYVPSLRQRWAAGCDNAFQLWREVQAQGYPGAASTVRQRLARWRQQPSRPGKKGPRHDPARARSLTPAPSAASRRTYSSRQTAWVLFKDDNSLTDDERTYVDHLLLECQPVVRLQTLARTFRDLVRLHDVVALARWLDAADQSAIPEVRGFAAGLRADRAAVEAGITLPWSQGQTEGQVNRLKTLKRAMYGRGKLDLLRIRLLHAA